MSESTPPSWFKDAIACKAKSFFITVENCRIHYQKWLQTESDLALKKPPLLFVHGGGAHVHWWDFIAPFFLEDYDVFAIDLSGMGDSEHRELYSDSLYAKELLAVCKHAGHTENISIVSHSYGGRSVLTLALEKPEVLKSIVITDCTLLSPAESGSITGRKNIPATPFGQKKIYSSKAAGLERFRLVPPQTCENKYLIDYIANYSIGPTDVGWSWKFDMDFVTKRCEGLDLLNNIHAIECPIANLYGEKSMLFPKKMVELYKKRYPSHTQFYCLPDAHHHLLLDQPLKFVEILKTILDTLSIKQLGSVQVNSL